MRYLNYSKMSQMPADSYYLGKKKPKPNNQTVPSGYTDDSKLRRAVDIIEAKASNQRDLNMLKVL